MSGIKEQIEKELNEATRCIRNVLRNGNDKSSLMTALGHLGNIDDIAEKIAIGNLEKKSAELCQHISISLRDHLASEALCAASKVWNSEMSNEHRIAVVKDMSERWPDRTIAKVMALDAYMMADAMIEARNEC